MTKRRLVGSVAAVVAVFVAVGVARNISHQTATTRQAVASGTPHAPSSNRAALPAASNDPASVAAARNLMYPELADVVRMVGTDPGALLSFVSGSIAYEPYVGALRGPRGTLLAAAGNSLDQALLLHDLMAVAHPDVQLRFASATLSGEASSDLISRFRHEPAAITPVARVLRAARQPSAATSGVGGSPRVAAAAVSDITDRGVRAWGALVDADRAATDMIAAPLAKAGVQFAAIPGEAALKAVAADHWWLQMQAAGGRWVDLDPTMRDARAGQSRAAALTVANTPPDAAYHHVSIGVTFETRESGHLTRHRLLSTAWRAADLSGSAITVLFIGKPSATQSGSVEYAPLLLVDGERRFGSPIALPAVPKSSAAIGGIAAGRVGGLLGGGAGRGPQTAVGPSPNESAVTAAWIEIGVTAPDRPTEVATRPIFDRIGFVARSAGADSTAPLAPFELAGGDYAALRTVWSVNVWTGERLRRRSLIETAAAGAELPVAWEAYEQLAALHRSLYPLREALFRSVNRAGRVLASTADVSLLSWSVGNTGGTLTVDLARSRATAAGPDDALAVATAWGTSGAFAERLLLTGQAMIAQKTSAAAGPAFDAIRLLEAVRAQAGTLAVISPPPTSIPPLQSAEASARLRADVAAGMFAVTSAQPVTVDGRAVAAWWLADPRLGIVIDEVENGGHQTTTEKSAVTTTEAADNPAAEGEGILERMGHNARCLAVASQLFLGASKVWGGMHGIPVDVVDGQQDVVDGIEGAAPECLEGDAGVNAPPVAAGGAPPPELPNGWRYYF